MPLGVIQHGVGDLQVKGVFGIGGRDDRNAPYADRDPFGGGRIVGNMEVFDGLTDLFDVFKHLFGVVPGGNGHEFLPAVAGQKVCAAL